MSKKKSVPDIKDLEEALSIIKPLVQAKGITVNSKKFKNTDTTYRYFLGSYNDLESDQKELAKFLAAQLAAQKTKGSFKGLNLTKGQKYDSDGNPMESYDFATKKISLHPHGKLNPIVKFIHEGTHALDDSPMKIYQKDAIDYLADVLKGKPIDTEPGDWYTEAQRILPAADFENLYPYGKIDEPGSVRQSIKDSFYNLDVPKMSELQSIMTFDKAKEKLDEEVQFKDRNLLFKNLSEFPAYAMENLFLPWNVKNANPISKGFLHKIMEGLNGEFTKLGLKDQDYPLVVQGFRDRMTQLGDSPIPRPISPRGLLVDSITSPASPKKDEDEEKDEKDHNQNTELKYVYNPISEAILPVHDKSQSYGPITRSKSQSSYYHPYSS